MADPDPLTEIKARRGWRGEDMLWLIGEIERLRQRDEESKLIRRSALHQAEAEAEVERLRGLLARLEWAGLWPDKAHDINAPGHSYCPACRYGPPEQGHDPAGCWLEDELPAEREKPPPGP